MDSKAYCRGAHSFEQPSVGYSEPRKRIVLTNDVTLTSHGLTLSPSLYTSPARSTCPSCQHASLLQLAPNPAPTSTQARLGRPAPGHTSSQLHRCQRGCRRWPCGCGDGITTGVCGWKGMGTGLACSLSQGPDQPSPSLRSASSSRTLSSATVLAIGLVLVIIMSATPSGTDARGLQIGGRSSSDSQRQLCNIHQCWDLYVDTQDYLNVHIDYEHERPHLDPEKHDAFCLATRTFYLCLKDMFRNKTLDCHGNIGFRSAFNGIERRMLDMNCSREGAVFDPSIVPPGPDHGLVCTYNGPPTMRFCSLFGDPHLRTFSDEFQTCQIQGAWPLLDNRYLTVQVTSKAVGAVSGPATAITEVTVMIKAHEDCAAERFVTYQAQAGFLPPMFDDGSMHFGPDHSVVLEEIEPNHHVEIYLRYISTTVVVRHYPSVNSPFLTVSLLMPEKILNQSTSHIPNEDTVVRTLELCSRGCPQNQRIDYMSYLAKAQSVIVSGSSHLFTEEKNTVEGMSVMMTRDEALQRCQNLHLVDMYLDSCVFDLMNTGETNFSQATADALADTVRLHPAGWGALHNRTTLKQLPNIDTSSARTLHHLDYLHRTTYVLLVAMVSCAFTSWWSGMVVSSVFMCSLSVSAASDISSGVL